jgi:nucleoside-diphosphate-sugar epimerase
MDLRARNRDALHVAVALVQNQRRYGSRGARASGQCDGGERRSCPSGEFVPSALIAQDSTLAVRFFQSRASAGGYALHMKILVTGATGKVGSRLTKRLARREANVRALVRDRTRAEDLREARVEVVAGDLLDADSLAVAVKGVDVVIHCAAFFRGATPEQAHAVNDLGTQHLASAARAAGVKRFIFTSTGLVYGSNGGRLAGEDDPCAPAAAYPSSKLAAERFLLLESGLDVYVLRLPFVYGDGDPHIQEAIPMMRSFPPAQRMSIGHHEDVAQAVARLLDTPSPAHRIYNVADDEAPDVATVFASVGAPPPDGSNAEFARNFDALADARRIREDLGFQPKFPRLADAIARGAL